MGNKGRDDYHSINELTGNIRLIIKGNESELEVESTVLEDSPRGCLDIEPITYEGKTVSFKLKGLSLTLVGCIDGMRIKFEVEKILLIKRNDGSIVHRVYCEAQSKCINQREYKRFSLGCEGTAVIGNRMKASCTVRDISYGGVGLGISGKLQIPVDQVLKISIFPDLQGKSDTVNVSGRSVRSLYNEEKDETDIGIKVTESSAQLRSLVTNIQREQLKKINHDNNLL